jgi:D-glycero-D-manno-heptose 1,7-bisphosphate phosphatase
VGIDTKRAVFLDRDGVVVRAIVRDGRPYAPLSLDEFEILPDAFDAIHRLKQAGFVCIVVTNQPEVARGTLPASVVHEMHDRLRGLLPVDAVEVCLHDDADGCSCRKPKPGLLVNAARAFDIDLHGSVLVGDRWRDIEAGEAAGCDSVFIDYGYAERRPTGAAATVGSLNDAVDWILSNHR